MMKQPVVGIIGSGAMGSGIAQVALQAGCRVLLFDANDVQLQKAVRSIENGLNKLVEKGKITAKRHSEAIANLKPCSTLNEFDATTLVIEAIVEDKSTKQQVFKDLESIVSEQCILASNTSSIAITSLASVLRKPNRFIGIHFFNPPVLMPLVEIIPGIASEKQLAIDMKMLITEWGKTVVIAKDTPGFLVNRVARSFYGESIRIAEENIADYATIDWAMKHFGGFRMGPFELMDFIGNDVNFKVTESVWTQFFYESRFKPSLTQQRLFEAGYLGRKSGKGYFDYSENSSFPLPTTNEIVGLQVFERVLAMLINEAYEALYLGIATREDLETAMTKGVNYPKGLLAWSEEWGHNKVLSVMDNLYETYREERYRASVLLRKLASQA